MNRFFITMVLVGSLLVSCTKFHESTGYEQLDNTTPKIGMLKFDSKQSLLNLIHGNEQTADNLIKHYSANKVVTLLTNGYMHLSNCESLDYTFLKDWGFSVNIDLVNLPNSYLDWAQRLNAKELLIKPKHLKYGAMFTAAQLDGQWVGMTITKD